MASETPVVELSDVSLRYRLAKQRIPSLKEYAIHWLKGALAYEDLWALRDIDLTVHRGEVVGILGRNGAGKSTLLKVVSGVLRPTRGTLRVSGRVAPILELGTGFDFELTGWENVYLNALLLGRRRAEVEEMIDEIVEFSGIGEFIQTPIRNYSSGMLARLGFSIATAWVPDLLILDEVLAVGDARFLRRCQERIDRYRERGTTILIVSHDAKALEAMCRRCVWLERGQLEADGPAQEVIDRYLDFSASDDSVPVRS